MPLLPSRRKPAIVIGDDTIAFPNLSRAKACYAGLIEKGRTDVRLIAPGEYLEALTPEEEAFLSGLSRVCREHGVWLATHSYGGSVDARGPDIALDDIDVDGDIVSFRKNGEAMKFKEKEND